jgi:hypothetical protein
LKAVGDVGSISAFKAVEDGPNVCAVAGVLIERDNLGRLGGEDCLSVRDMMDEDCLHGASML